MPRLARMRSTAALLLAAATAAGMATPADGHHRARPSRVHAHYLTGIGDESSAMFTDPLWRRLGTRIARYVAPYDAAVDPRERALARAWITAASRAHQEILVAFYHSEETPMRLPSVRAYARDVARFIGMFPQVREYQPWNEANRGTVPRLLRSPSPVGSARYYAALRRVCRRCTIVGLDVLDQADVRPTLRYIAAFKRAVHRLRVPEPRLWGLHNYSDTNRFSDRRTLAVARATRGTLWLTETGGVVHFGRAFPNRHGSGLARAARALRYMFHIADVVPSVRRLYIYSWSGGTPSTRFDAGLTDAHGRPRPGYRVVCDVLLRDSPRCRVPVSRH